MSSDLVRPSDELSPRPERTSGRGRMFAVASAGLALTVSASIAIGRIQDPADPDAAPAKTQDATKKAAPKAEAPAPDPALPAPVAAGKGEPAPPPGFSRVPKTPSEIWEVVDFFVRSRQAPAAVPYLRRFIALHPDDAVFLALRDEFGEGAFLRLGDHDATRPYLKPIYDRLAAAIVKRTNDPERIRGHLDALAKSDDERRHAIRELRPAGSNAVPPILETYRAASDDGKKRIADALGRLDRNAVPALVALLDAKDATEAAVAAEALGKIGDARAIPALTWVAARGVDPAKSAAAQGVERLTGLPFDAQAKLPTQVLADAARKAHLRDVSTVADNPTIWVWSDASKLPEAKAVTRTEALGVYGQRYAKAALAIDPSNLDAQTTAIALTLDRSQPGSIPPSVLAAGSEALGRVLAQAVADGRYDLATKTIAAMARVSDRNGLGTTSKLNPLVEALAAPDRRVQFAAAEALVNLEAKGSFPGSSRLVPVLARFAANPRQHGAVVIDGNAARGGTLIGHLQPIGYDAQLAQTGEDGFRIAAGSANIEMILIEPSYLAGAWKTHDTLANLRADARTAGLPIFLVGPLTRENQIAQRFAAFPGLHFLVTPTESSLFKTQIDRALNAQGVRPLSEAERSAYALKASQLLTKLAQTKNGPFTADLATVEPNLILALNSSATSESVAAALGELPGHDAQRGLADVLLDGSRPAPARLKAGEALAHSLRRFGPLLTAGQEARLTQALDNETDPALRTTIATVVGALKPKPAAVGRMLRSDRLSTTTR